MEFDTEACQVPSPTSSDVVAVSRHPPWLLQGNTGQRRRLQRVRVTRWTRALERWNPIARARIPTRVSRRRL